MHYLCAQAVDYHAELRRKRVQLVASFVAREHLPPKLRKQLFRQLDAEYSQTNGIEVSPLLSEFPRSLVCRARSRRVRIERRARPSVVAGPM